MLIIAGHYSVDATRRDADVEAFRGLVERARRTPRCLDLAITADPFEPGRVDNYERWENEEALTAFRAIADPPELDVELVGMQMSKFTIESESDPFS